MVWYFGRCSKFNRINQRYLLNTCKHLLKRIAAQVYLHKKDPVKAIVDNFNRVFFVFCVYRTIGWLLTFLLYNFVTLPIANNDVDTFLYL